MEPINIHHLDIQYQIPKQQASSAAIIQRRLDSIASNLLSRIWENEIFQDNETDTTLYFIDSMSVNLTLDSSITDDRRLADAWTNALHTGILRTLSQRDTYIVIFRNRAEFLASFLDDLLQQRAWNYWYYQEFTALRSLSMGEVIVQVLTEDGDIGRDTLMTLTRQGNLELLLNLLSDVEINTIVSQCLLPPSPILILPNVYQVWLHSLQSFLVGFTFTANISRDLTKIYLSLLRYNPELGPDVNLARFIHDLLQLRQSIMEITHPSLFLAQVAAGNIQAFTHLNDVNSKRFLANLFSELSNNEVIKLLSTLQVEIPQPVISKVFTCYGGIFLLIPIITELKLPRFLENCPYPEPQGISKTGLLLFLIALQCLGKNNIKRSQQDRGVAIFAGLSQPPSPHQLQEYAANLTPKMHRDFTVMFQNSVPNEYSLCLDESFLPNHDWDGAVSNISAIVLYKFAAKLGAFASSSPDYLRRHFLESHAEIEISNENLIVNFITCPLQVILRMAGFEYNTWEVSWLDKQKTLKFIF